MICVLQSIQLFKKLSSYWIYFLIGLVLLITPIQPVNANDCSGPSEEHSSKHKCFGIGGRPLGKDCPNMELYWGSKEEGSSNIFFRNPSGKIFKVAEGMAIFSSTCKYYWHTGYYEQKEFKVFSTNTGKSIIKTIGQYPAWSYDGESIYFFRTNKSSRQLWELNVKYKRESLLIEVQDFLPCFQEGDEVEWYPVIVTKEGYILWSYWVKDPEIEGYTNAAKKLTIDAKRKKIIKVEHKDSCPCLAFEELN